VAPCGQTIQAELPYAGWYLPASHAEHLSDNLPVSLNEPGKHRLHAVIPAFADSAPLWQIAHDVWPGKAPYFPGVHAVHLFGLTS